jgi:hypothetical protein
MGLAYRGPLRVPREQLVRAVLLVAPLPRVGGCECFHVFLRDRTLVE